MSFAGEQHSTLFTLEGLSADDDDDIMNFTEDESTNDTEEFLQQAEHQLQQTAEPPTPSEPPIDLVQDSQVAFDQDFDGEWQDREADLQRFKDFKGDITELARLAGEKKKLIQQQVSQFNLNNPTKFVKQLRIKIEDMTVKNEAEMVSKFEAIQNFNYMMEVSARVCITSHHITHITSHHTTPSQVRRKIRNNVELRKMLFELMESFKNVPDGVEFNNLRQDLVDLKAAIQAKKRSFLAAQARELDIKLNTAEEAGEKGKKQKVNDSCKCLKSQWCSRPNNHSGQCNKSLAK